MTMTLKPKTRGLTSPGRQLQLDMAAVRVSFTWLGVRRALSREQKEQAAESFGAEGDYLSAAKKLLDTSHPAFKAVTAVRGRALNFWRGMSLPFPEPVVSLIRRDLIEQFDRQMGDLKEELMRAVGELDGQYGELKTDARQQLGSLYNPSDYPPSLRQLFAMEWDFPTIEPPQYLLELSPRLFEEERQRIASRFDEAVQMAEQAFIAELSKLVGHLSERLSGGADGQKRIFRDSAITNLREFFDRFRNLNVHSSAELDRLVNTARQTIEGIDPQDVRDNQALRQQVSTQLSSVQSVLEGMMIDQPRRRILRTSGKEAG